MVFHHTDIDLVESYFARLSNMKASWKRISEEVQNSLMVALEATSKDLNEQGISNSLYRYGTKAMKHR